jgi:GDPmannose 4,6-dehydratase
MRKAMIIGYSGQDGGYLFDLLKDKGYIVIGIGRSTVESYSVSAPEIVDILSPHQIRKLVMQYPVDEIYYLAAHQHSAEMGTPDDYQLFSESFDVHVSGLLNLLESVKEAGNKTRVFYAGSSHIYGDVSDFPQSESTPQRPNSIYGISKQTGMHLMRYYRETYGMFCASGILFNHESPRRSPKFLLQKIATSAVAIKRRNQSQLSLGNLSAKCDWGFAGDYVEAMWRILQLEDPSDFVIGSGSLHTVREFVEIVFTLLDLDWQKYVVEKPVLIKKKEQQVPLLGDTTKLQVATGWKPRTCFEELARLMTESALEKQTNE